LDYKEIERRMDMNLTQFIKAVDQAAENMTLERMADFLHDYARSISTDKREAFLERLVAYAGGK